MADNIDEEHLENQTNNESKNLSDNFPPTKDIETIKQNQETDMEVHHHPKVEKKNFKEYFIEFIMIFLAVTMGFIAENIREHQVEKESENVYIKNMYEDLKSDTTIYFNYNTDSEKFSNAIDSLFALLKDSDRRSHLNKIYFLARTATMNTPQLYPNKRTYIQMKNSGLLRLIHNQDVADKVSAYYLSLEPIETQNETIATRIADYMQSCKSIFDGEVFLIIRRENKVPSSDNLKLISNNPVDINGFLMSAQYLDGSRSLQNVKGLNASKNAKELMTLIKKEYHLE